VLVLPINMFKHWFCIIVTNPAALLVDSLTNLKGKCQLIFCDSMFEMRDFVVQAIRMYESK
jgi:Ulp1 family protease